MEQPGQPEQRHAGDGRTYRVPYGHHELEFTPAPWFEVEVLSSSPATGAAGPSHPPGAQGAHGRGMNPAQE